MLIVDLCDHHSVVSDTAVLEDDRKHLPYPGDEIVLLPTVLNDFVDQIVEAQ